MDPINLSPAALWSRIMSNEFELEDVVAISANTPLGKYIPADKLRQKLITRWPVFKHVWNNNDHLTNLNCAMSIVHWVKAVEISAADINQKCVQARLEADQMIVDIDISYDVTDRVMSALHTSFDNSNVAYEFACHIINSLCEREHTRYFPEKLLESIKQHRVRRTLQDIRDGINVGPSMDVAVGLVQDWWEMKILNKSSLSYVTIQDSMDAIRKDVLRELRRRNPNHGIFSRTEEFLNWRNNNVSAEWNVTEGVEILHAIHQTLKSNFQPSDSYEGYFVQTVLQTGYSSIEMLRILCCIIARRMGLRCMFHDSMELLLWIPVAATQNSVHHVYISVNWDALTTDIPLFQNAQLRRIAMYDENIANSRSHEREVIIRLSHKILNCIDRNCDGDYYVLHKLMRLVQGNDTLYETEMENYGHDMISIVWNP